MIQESENPMRVTVVICTTTVALGKITIKTVIIINYFPLVVGLKLSSFPLIVKYYYELIVNDHNSFFRD